MAVTLTYATLEQVQDYLGNFGGDWSALTEEQVWVAEQDVDEAVRLPRPNYPVLDTQTLMVDPTLLNSAQQVWLQQAVAEQVKYRAMMPSDFFDRDQYQAVSQEGITRQGTISLTAPRALEKLARAGLLHMQSYDRYANVAQAIDDIYWGPSSTLGVPIGDDGVSGRYGDPEA